MDSLRCCAVRICLPAVSLNDAKTVSRNLRSHNVATTTNTAADTATDPAHIRIHSEDISRSLWGELTKKQAPKKATASSKTTENQRFKSLIINKGAWPPASFDL